MIAYILLWYIGASLNLPSWFYAVLVFGMLLKIVGFGLKMYKAGMED